MTKTINHTAAILAATLFSGAVAAAIPDLEGDIVHGGSRVPASPASPYVQVDSGQKGIESYLLWNLHEIDQSDRFTPYVRTEGELDNHDDLIDQA